MSEIVWGIIGVVISVTWAEFTEWAPWLAKRILKDAIKKVPIAQRERVAEELAGLLNESPEKLWKLCTASSLWWGLSQERFKQKFRENALDLTQRGIDIFSACIFFVIFFPSYVIIYFLIRATSPGPVHVSETRIGKDGKKFEIYKFRTMVSNADEVLETFLKENAKAQFEWDKFQSLSEDPRITPVGAFLRRMSLDELPQFFNVLKGDMSIIGPRPCKEQHRELYGENWNEYCKVRPGLTGLWQISKRNLLSFAQRIALDVEYVKNRSLWMNIVILAKTVYLVWKGSDKK